MMRNFIKTLADLFFPPKCAACGEVTESNRALCGECLKKYAAETEYTCPSCGENARKCRCGDMTADVCLTFYSGFYSADDRVTEKLIFALKHKKNVMLADFFAVDMASEIVKKITLDGRKCGDHILAHLPRGEKNFEKYGFDHGELLCSRISRYTGIPKESLFIRHGGAEQKKMGYRERLDNANDTLDLSSDADVAGRRIILIDDIITTGATVKRAAELLHSAGADEVICAVIAKTVRKGGSGR